MAHVHAAAAHTGAAAVAALLIHPHTHQAEAVEQPVDRAERADKTAETPVAEPAGQSDDQHDRELAGKEDTQHAEQSRVVGIGQQADRTLKGSGGTDVFAKARHGNIMLQPIPQRDRHNKNGEHTSATPRFLFYMVD